MDKWFKYILPDKDPYHNRGRDQMRKKGGPDFKCLWLLLVDFIRVYKFGANLNFNLTTRANYAI